MNYKRIIKQIAASEKTSAKKVEKEMELAIRKAGLSCSVEDFLKIALTKVKERTIYSNIV